ncbi:hypothetical protein CONLIGDRAFT_631147 [Coniochaeta ligniaria NRRL 30616]|uniref:Uncharacterized protein n=1 Tax=Coniochaeta ligniaria NRRL 30616 TaxID=1408157 RepID=A0A1J7IU71_9PEZI|nr:hypothetical protein CONLIGDRAFT_631147 [Coniochaeta ligniaria NRRL 30616]
MPPLFHHSRARDDDGQASQVVFSVIIGVMAAILAFACVYCTVHWFRTRSGRELT